MKSRALNIASFAVLLLLAVFVAVFGVFAGNYTLADSDFSGSGTEYDPYVIGSAGAWNQFAVFHNAENLGAVSVRLSQNISFSSFLIPIRTFRGKFDGGSFAVINPAISASVMDTVALFLTVEEGAVVENLSVFGGTVSGSLAGVTEYGASIAGINRGTIRSCFSTAFVGGAKVIGGIVAVNAGGTIENSYFSGEISVLNGGIAGGIAGIADFGKTLGVSDEEKIGNISFGFSLAKINGNGDIGGLIGRNLLGTKTVLNSQNQPETVQIINLVCSRLFYSTDTLGQSGKTAVFGMGDDGERFVGLQNSQISTLQASELGSAVWRRAFASANFSADFAPALITFADNPSTLSIARESVTIRRYGHETQDFDSWGSEQNPFIISAPLHLINLSNAVNRNGFAYSGLHFKLSQDISMLGVTSFAPIGAGAGTGSGIPFRGTLDGDGHTISHLVIDNPAEYWQGFFQNLSGTVKNLNFDETCRITGLDQVATVASYAVGAVIENVSTSAVLSGNEVGGIVAIAQASTIRNCLSNVTISTRNQIAYGILWQNSGNQIINSWYVAEKVGSNEGYPANPLNAGGNKLVVDANGGCEPSLTNGVVRFTALPNLDGGFSQEFRFRDETTITDRSVYVPDSRLENETVYLRFVKRLSVERFTNIGGLLACEFVFGTLTSTADEASFYENQTVTITARIYYGRYLTFVGGAAGRELLNLSVTPSSTAGLDHVRLSIQFNMHNDLTGVIYTVAEMGVPAVAPAKVYDALPYAYDEDTLPKPEGFIFSATDFGGTSVAPVNAGEYSLFVAVRSRLNGVDLVVCGRQVLPFEIEKAELTIPTSALAGAKTKQWDSLSQDAGVPLPVIQAEIGGVALADRAEGNNPPKVIVEADVLFTDPSNPLRNNPGEGYNLVYRFSLSGASANNYALTNYSGGIVLGEEGVITRRVVELYYSEGAQAERLFRTYGNSDSFGNPQLTADGSAVRPFENFTNFEYVTGKGPVGSVEPSPRAVVSFWNGSEWDYSTPCVNAGTYRIEVVAQASSFYEAVFAVKCSSECKLSFSECADCGYYELIVAPRPVDLQYINTVFDYDGNEKQAVATYTNVFGNVITLNSFSYKQGGQAVSYVKDAGTYEAHASLSGNYMASASTKSAVITVNKANQPAFNIEIGEPQNGINYAYGDTAYLLSLNDASGGAVTFSIVKGFAEIVNGSSVLFTGGGEVIIKAVKAESDNYNLAETTLTINVSKSLISLSLDASKLSFYYGEEISILNLMIFGGGETPSGFLPPKFMLNGESYEAKSKFDWNAQTYAFTIVQDAISNEYDFDYSFFNSPLTLTILKPQIEIRADEKSAVYGDSSLSLTYKVYLLNGNVSTLMNEADYSINIEFFVNLGLGNVNDYQISFKDIQAIRAENPNYSISEIYGAMYFILPYEIIINMVSGDPSYPNMRKDFGEDDPELSWGNFVFNNSLPCGNSLVDTVKGKNGESFPVAVMNSRISGENAFSTNDSSLPYGFYRYQISPQDLVPLPNYKVTLNEIFLHIFPAEVKFTKVSDEPIGIQYGDELSRVNLASVISTRTAGVNVTGIFAWDNPSHVPSLAIGDDSLNFGFRFTPNASQRNFVLTFGEVELEIIKRQIRVEFVAEAVREYNGLSHHTATYVFSNNLPADALNAQMRCFSGSGNAPLSLASDVGNYRYEVSINNPNYEIVADLGYTVVDGNAVFAFAITPKKLFIGVEDLEHVDTVTTPPDYVFTYSGFIAGQNENMPMVLVQKPSIVSVPQMAGIHTVTPQGATAPNYSIEYLSGTHHILKSRLTGGGNAGFAYENDSGFAGNTAVSVNSVGGEALDKVRADFANERNILGLIGTRIEVLYKVDFSGATKPEGGRAEFVIPQNIRGLSVNVVTVKDGKISRATQTRTDGEVISFNYTDADFFAIVALDAQEPISTTLIIALAVSGGGIAVIAVLVAVGFALRNKKAIESGKKQKVNSRFD
ncbi:MAG: hypothetical protein FWD49_03165 [Firmicutes bacterium]|nr:hypothetical protein [Bacillota bacterium]